MSIKLDGLPENCTISVNSQGRVFAWKKFDDGWTRVVRWGTTVEEDEAAGYHREWYKKEPEDKDEGESNDTSKI